MEREGVRISVYAVVPKGPTLPADSPYCTKIHNTFFCPSLDKPLIGPVVAPARTVSQIISLGPYFFDALHHCHSNECERLHLPS